MTNINVSLAVVPSRYNIFWFELVLIVNDEVIKSYGQYRSEDEADGAKKTYQITTN
jgi:hypothetical protein